ncbi:MAG: serine dehydratase beta chain, partial [Bacillota bacterium]
MTLPSIFSVFKIGIGPSSSHTIGALKSAQYFKKLITGKNFGQNAGIQIELLGSLALTGLGHLTNFAAAAGLGDFDFLSRESRIQKVYQEIEPRGYINIAGTD